uniref:Uncharacterized protein n=1 Tax=Glossina austeni TaxID=7395 RepID=A0A1A9V8E7_GLOAU
MRNELIELNLQHYEIELRKTEEEEEDCLVLIKEIRANVSSSYSPPTKRPNLLRTSSAVSVASSKVYLNNDDNRLRLNVTKDFRCMPTWQITFCIRSYKIRGLHVIIGLGIVTLRVVHIN